MNAMECEQFMNRVNQALNRPIQNRCAELTVLFDRGHIKELQALFPILVDHIFGPQATVSWELRTTTVSTNSQNFQALQHFLSPHGPIFKLISVLLRDTLIKYDFSLAFLPMKIRQLLESQCAHPFYSELINVSPQTKQMVSLQLNPFDYYMFHFAYHLINPWHQRNTNMSTWSTVYYMLCCDYVLHYLPTDPNCPVLPMINFYSGKNPTQCLQTVVSYRPTRTTKLLRNSIFQEPANEFNSIHQPLERHPRNEIWRSETVLTVFIDMWLGNDQLNNRFEDFNLSTSRSLHFNELPTGEYIRIIRVLVKQIHAFSSSAKVDDTYMAELKKLALPMLQGKIYVFLRNLVHRWPLDGSFRLVLELWLSFIQPWRYPGNLHLKSNQEINLDLDDMNVVPQKSVDREFLPFIAENLLAYIVIFQQLLPRFARVDLASPKNSLMLYRLTKVFDQPNLIQLLRDIETGVENGNANTSPTHSYNSSWQSNMPPLSPTTSWSTNTSYFNTTNVPPKNNSTYMDASSAIGGKYYAIVRQKIYELEGPNFCYKPLFSVPPATEVLELIRQIRKAEKMAQELIQARLDELIQQHSGFFGFFKSLVGSFEFSNDEFTLEERKKVPVYLDFALQQLTNIFDVTNTDVEVQTSSHDVNLINSTLNGDNLEKLLTPEKVRERVKTLTYDGDPDLHPVRSNENKFLVRTLYQLSTKINDECRPTLYKFYNDPSFLGRLARQLMCPPTTVFKYDKTQPGRSPRVPVHLPPRISFRCFASHKFLAYVVLGIMTSNLLGYRITTLIVFVLFMCVLYLCLRALLQKPEINPTTCNPRNISFNDSF